MDISSTTFCPGCEQLVSVNDNFCPHCGHVLKPAAFKLSFYSQITAYAISLFLPPFGFWYVLKYLRQEDPKIKRVGIICAILTAVSIIYTFYLFSGILNSATQSINSLNGLMN